MENFINDFLFGVYTGTFFGVYATVIALVCVLPIVCNWAIFKKAGLPGVASIVPFWNTAVLFDITWHKWYYMFLLLIPVVNIIIAIITCFKLAEVFGKGTGFGFGLWLLNPIFMMILAFGKAQYVCNEDIPSPDKTAAAHDFYEESMFSDLDGKSVNDADTQRMSFDTDTDYIKAHDGAGRRWQL